VAHQKVIYLLNDFHSRNIEIILLATGVWQRARAWRKSTAISHKT
jgi:hypothetical protein